MALAPHTSRSDTTKTFVARWAEGSTCGADIQQTASSLSYNPSRTHTEIIGMKLIGAEVELFRNIINSTPVDIQPDVTSLVGKNESGKTAFLHALYRLNPARPNAPLNLSQQYPAWRIKQDRLA